MTKRFSIFICVLLTAIAVSVIAISALSCNTGKKPVSADYIQADWILKDDLNYIDYADKVFLNDEKYPILKKQGMFWWKWDEASQKFISAPADSEEGASFVDPSKPTLIHIHGMEQEGKINDFIPKDLINVKSELGIDELQPNNLSLLYGWHKKGWNIGHFQYEIFSAVPNPIAIEQNVWGHSSTVKHWFKTADGQSHYDPYIGDVQYSVAEHFVAEYMRAMKLLPQSFGDQEIRFAAHSMGGEVTAVGLYILGHLAHKNVGMLNPKHLPVRYSLMDTYFNASMGKGIVLSEEGKTFCLTDKLIPKTGIPQMLIDCLKFMHNEYGIVMDYYTYDSSFLRLGMQPEIAKQLLEIVSFSDVLLNWDKYYPPASGFAALAGWRMTKGHVAIQYWYLFSILAGDLTAKDADGNITSAPSAAMATEKLKETTGKYYQLYEGNYTIRISDDTFFVADADFVLAEYPKLPTIP